MEFTATWTSNNRYPGVFRTVQEAATSPTGQACSDWTVRYWLALDSGSWRIDQARTQGSPKACTATVP